MAASGSWEAGSWEAGSWEAGSWEAGSWEAGSWEAGSWEAGSWETSSLETVVSGLVQVDWLRARVFLLKTIQETSLAAVSSYVLFSLV